MDAKKFWESLTDDEALDLIGELPKISGEWTFDKITKNWYRCEITGYRSVLVVIDHVIDHDKHNYTWWFPIKQRFNKSETLVSAKKAADKALAKLGYRLM